MIFGKVIKLELRIRTFLLRAPLVFTKENYNADFGLKYFDLSRIVPFDILSSTG
jgi:hypothetical protein